MIVAFMSRSKNDLTQESLIQRDTLVIDKKSKGRNKMKFSNYRNNALAALRAKAESDKRQALASLQLMLDHPAGIGDHSTGDLYDNLNEALSNLADAEDRLDTLDIYGDFLKH